MFAFRQSPCHSLQPSRSLASCSASAQTVAAMERDICQGPGTGDTLTQVHARSPLGTTASYSHMGSRCSRGGEGPVPPRMDFARGCPCAASGAISPRHPWGWRFPHLSHAGRGGLLLQRPKYAAGACLSSPEAIVITDCDSLAISTPSAVHLQHISRL